MSYGDWHGILSNYGVKIGSPISEWNNFFIQNFIEVILASLENYICVEYEKKNWCTDVSKFHPKKTSFYALKFSHKVSNPKFPNLVLIVKMVPWEDYYKVEEFYNIPAIDKWTQRS